MISYRGVESTDCFGMQPVVEPVLGLCGNLKPNRFFKTERKRFFKGLAVARPFIFDEGNMPRMYPFTTNIKADYLISSHLNIDNYIFIIKESSHDELKCDFLCCSIFAKGDRDYEANQRLRKLMKKERIHLPTNTHNILLNKLSV